MIMSLIEQESRVDVVRGGPVENLISYSSPQGQTLNLLTGFMALWHLPFPLYF